MGYGRCIGKDPGAPGQSTSRSVGQHRVVGPGEVVFVELLGLQPRRSSKCWSLGTSVV